jgi:hypothetical protein
MFWHPVAGSHGRNPPDVRPIATSPGTIKLGSGYCLTTLRFSENFEDQLTRRPRSDRLIQES